MDYEHWFEKFLACKRMVLGSAGTWADKSAGGVAGRRNTGFLSGKRVKDYIFICPRLLIQLGQSADGEECTARANFPGSVQ